MPWRLYLLRWLRQGVWPLSELEDNYRSAKRWQRHSNNYQFILEPAQISQNQWSNDRAGEDYGNKEIKRVDRFVYSGTTLKLQWDHIEKIQNRNDTVVIYCTAMIFKFRHLDADNEELRSSHILQLAIRGKIFVKKEPECRRCLWLNNLWQWLEQQSC